MTISELEYPRYNGLDPCLVETNCEADSRSWKPKDDLSRSSRISEACLKTTYDSHECDDNKNTATLKMISAKPSSPVSDGPANLVFGQQLQRNINFDCTDDENDYVPRVLSDPFNDSKNAQGCLDQTNGDSSDHQNIDHGLMPSHDVRKAVALNACVVLSHAESFVNAPSYCEHRNDHDTMSCSIQDRKDGNLTNNAWHDDDECYKVTGDFKPTNIGKVGIEVCPSKKENCLVKTNEVKIHDQEDVVNGSIFICSKDQVNTCGCKEQEEDAMSDARSENSHRTAFTSLFSRRRYGAIRRIRKHGSYNTGAAASTQRKGQAKAKKGNKRSSPATREGERNDNNEFSPLLGQCHDQYADGDTRNGETCDDDGLGKTTGITNYSFWNYRKPNRKTSRKSSQEGSHHVSSQNQLDGISAPHFDGKDQDHYDSEYSTTGSLSSYSCKRNQSPFRRKMESAWQQLIQKPSESSNHASGSLSNPQPTPMNLSIIPNIRTIHRVDSRQSQHRSIVATENDCQSVTSARSISDISNSSQWSFLQHYRSKMSRSLGRWKKSVPKSIEEPVNRPLDNEDTLVPLLLHSEGVEKTKMDKKKQELESSVDKPTDRLLHDLDTGQLLRATNLQKSPAPKNIEKPTEWPPESEGARAPTSQYSDAEKKTKIDKKQDWGSLIEIQIDRVLYDLDSGRLLSPTNSPFTDNEPLCVDTCVNRKSPNPGCTSRTVQSKYSFENLLEDSDRGEDVVVFMDSEGVSTNSVNDDSMVASNPLDDFVPPNDSVAFLSIPYPATINNDFEDHEEQNVVVFEGNSVRQNKCYDLCAPETSHCNVRDSEQHDANDPESLQFNHDTLCSHYSATCKNAELSQPSQPNEVALPPAYAEASEHRGNYPLRDEIATEIQVSVEDIKALATMEKQLLSSTRKTVSSSNLDKEKSHNATTMTTTKEFEESARAKGDPSTQLLWFSRPRLSRPFATRRTTSQKKSRFLSNMDDDLCFGGSESSQCGDGVPSANGRASQRLSIEKGRRKKRTPFTKQQALNSSSCHDSDSSCTESTPKSSFSSHIHRLSKQKYKRNFSGPCNEMPQHQRWKTFRVDSDRRDSSSVSEASKSDASHSSRGSLLHRYTANIGKTIRFFQRRQQHKSETSYTEIPDEDDKELLPNSTSASRILEKASGCPPCFNHQRSVQSYTEAQYNLNDANSNHLDGQRDYPSLSFSRKQVENQGLLDDVKTLEDSSEDEHIKLIASNIKQSMYGKEVIGQAPNESTSSFIQIVFPCDMEIVVSSKKIKMLSERIDAKDCEMKANTIDDDSSCSNESNSTCSTLTTPSIIGKMSPTRPLGLTIRDGYIEYSLAATSMNSDSSRSSNVRSPTGKNSALMAHLRSTIEQHHQDKIQNSSTSTYKMPMHIQINDSSGRKISILLTQSIQKIFEIVTINVEPSTSVGEILASARSNAVDERLSSQEYVSLCSDTRDVSDLASPISELINLNQDDYYDCLHGLCDGVVGASGASMTKNEIMKRRMEKMLLVAIPVGSNAVDCQRIRRVLWRNPKLQKWWKSQQGEYRSLRYLQCTA